MRHTAQRSTWACMCGCACVGVCVHLTSSHQQVSGDVAAESARAEQQASGGGEQREVEGWEHPPAHELQVQRGRFVRQPGHARAGKDWEETPIQGGILGACQDVRAELLSHLLWSLCFTLQ